MRVCMFESCIYIYIYIYINAKYILPRRLGV